LWKYIAKVRQVNEVNVEGMEEPKPEEVRAQVDRLHCDRRFKEGTKLRWLLDLIVEEWLKDRGHNLTEKYIGEASGEPLTFESSGKLGYPQTRGQLGHVRSRLIEYFGAEGYRDQVTIKLISGSYVPVVVYNPLARSIPELEPAVDRLILRAKTALDARTLHGALLAIKYCSQIPINWENPRQAASMLFVSWAASPIVPGVIAKDVPFTQMAIAKIKASRLEPWEVTFVDACVEACVHHKWRNALVLFERAVKNSHGEAKYFWWYTALLACTGRTEEAIEILDGAVRHFSRSNLAMRTDLAQLLTMAGRPHEAEEVLSASLDFASEHNPRLVSSFAMVLEAQDRLEEAAVPIVRMNEELNSAMSESSKAVLESVWAGEYLYSDSSADELLKIPAANCFIQGMLALILGRMKDTDTATEILDSLLRLKEIEPAVPSVEIAIGMIGVGRFDDAVKWLRRGAFEENDPIAMWFHIFPPLRHLRRHRGFRTLLKDLNLRPQRSR
jgi:hypothetical protein